jgi:hypothetical protein
MKGVVRHETTYFYTIRPQKRKGDIIRAKISNFLSYLEEYRSG